MGKVLKDDAERAIRSLYHDWRHELGLPSKPVDQPSYREFKAWCEQKGYGGYFDFKTTVANADYFAMMWFDQEAGQAWRN